MPDNLPAVPDGAIVDEAPLEGIVVDEEPAPKVVVLAPVVNIIAVVINNPVPRTAVRHGGHVIAGAVVLYRRRRQGRTLAERMAHDLHARGESDKAALMLKAASDDRHRRHERRISGIRTTTETMVLLARNIHWLIIATVAVMLGLGLMLGNPAWPFETAVAAVKDGRLAMVWGLRIGLVAVPAAAVLALYIAGRTAGDLAPNWARTAGDAGVDITIDERTVTQAIANMRFPQVRDYLKTGAPMQFLVPCRQEGRGTYFEVRLPGIPAEKIVRRRADFAAGLHRLPKEVWPSMGSEAAVLKGWIADKGALEEGAGPYPLLSEGFTDVFKGLPFGKILKGDPSRIPVIGRNTACGGMPEQGKSNGARVVACGYTLDLVTELRIYVPDTNFDFEGFKPRCSRYLMGAEDEFIEQMLEEQELLKEELQARGQLLVDYGVQEVTREIAHAGVGLHPVFILLEEAHVALQHKKFGKDFGQLLGENVKLDRKRAVHIFVSTQAPVRGSMPPDVTRNCANGIAFAVGDHYANDALLGAGAYSAGHRATELIPGTDRGTALCKGFSGERSEIVQVHRIQASRGNDQVSPIVRRALEALAADGRQVPGTGRPLAIVSRDLLTDIETVIAGRAGRVRVNDLPEMLRNLAKSWGPYRSLTGKELRRLLDEEGVSYTNTDNRPELDPADLHRAIRDRERMSELP